jgi:hypothetical protein
MLGEGQLPKEPMTAGGEAVPVGEERAAAQQRRRRDASEGTEGVITDVRARVRWERKAGSSGAATGAEPAGCRAQAIVAAEPQKKEERNVPGSYLRYHLRQTKPNCAQGERASRVEAGSGTDSGERRKRYLRVLIGQLQGRKRLLGRGRGTEEQRPWHGFYADAGPGGASGASGMPGFWG